MAGTSGGEGAAVANLALGGLRLRGFSTLTFTKQAAAASIWQGDERKPRAWFLEPKL